MARYTCFLLGATVVALVVGGLLVYFLDDNRGSVGDNSEAVNLLVAGGSILGTILWWEFLWAVWERKSHTASKGNGFPDKRSSVLRVCTAVYFVIFLLAIQWPVTAFIGAIYYYSFGFVLPERASRWVGQKLITFNIFAVWVNPFWKIRFVGTRKKAPVGGAIYMSNHLTFADSFITSSMLWPIECKYVATAWVNKVPFAGFLSRIGGNLPIKFVKQPDGTFKTDKDVVANTMARAKEYLENGENMFVYPEGTLSKDGTLKEFKGSAFFKLAIDLEIPIVPVAMWGNQTLWLHGEWVPQPGYAEFTYGEPIQVSKDDDVDQVKAKVREAMRELRDSLPLYQVTSGQILHKENNPLHAAAV
mmetsp:Transcript_11933/g.13746  ORF Transcript_11933/g.13746 Transcript_11933/m.13746 type:complete len:360 (-) Transcript_11933:116-1195(-)